LLTDGSFSALVRESGAVLPFSILAEEFNKKLFLLVDGFVQGYKAPILEEEEKRFTKWQERATRKDVERAFGVLQSKLKATAHPIHLIDLKHISNMVATCIVMHNMGVCDRVIGDVSSIRSRPSNKNAGVAKRRTVEEGCPDSDEEVPGDDPPTNPTTRLDLPATTGINRIDASLARTIAMREEWKGLNNADEWAQLQSALIEWKNMIMNL
jgi:Plant transposon protein